MKLENYINFNKIIYETYKLSNNNYYNCINLNYLLANYKNDDEKYLREILLNKYDETVELFLQKDIENKKDLEMNQK